MGDRISISFMKDGEESVAFFSHWDGLWLKKKVTQYVKERIPKTDSQMLPLDRREPHTVIIDFVSWLTKGERMESNYYLGKDGNDGDNSDNGHWIFDLNTDKWKRK